MLLSGAGDMTLPLPTTAWRPRLSASAIPYSGSSAMRPGGNERTARDEEVPPSDEAPRERMRATLEGETKEQAPLYRHWLVTANEHVD